ncbi:site-specific DNA-methyltransferase [Candidatus Parcubacteria bacterium]|nr:MAG: site-specific DNA-methyltransferase [Candidatus Parcubacteria bacterium]
MAKILKYKKRRPASLRINDGSHPQISLFLGDALDKYAEWPTPTAIISDGPYGLGKFPGDPNGTETLAEWYAPHVAEWSRRASAETTLWFWCSEQGWAEVHRVLKLHGWKYKAAHIWDKGIGHVAGNCNGDTIRGFPVVTEMCVQYVRDVQLRNYGGQQCSIKEWLRSEWLRTGLPLYKANEACGVKNAATRKYLTQCHLWYFPPPEKMEMLAKYANKHGAQTDKPYFSLDGKTPLTAKQWERMRAKWNHVHGATNVWHEPPVRGKERFIRKGMKSLHANQKPLKLMERIIGASTDPGDAVWEPFGGLCSATVAALRMGRECYAAEVNPEYYDVASARIIEVCQELQLYEQKQHS